jgi:hypothetical protein
MRHFSIALMTAVLVGCGSTRTVQTDLRDTETLREINERVGRQEATVILKTHIPRTYKVRDMRLKQDSLILPTHDYYARADDAEQILFRSKTHLGRGALVGGLVGGLGIGVALAVDQKSCQETGGWFCMSEGAAFGIEFGLGALTGAVVGGIVGAVTGSPGTIYRFRPDTPQQMSALIGVGPSVNTD